MKKLLAKLFLFLIFCFLFVKNVDAFDFVKSSENPLKVTYINNYAHQLQHHIFKEENIYKGIFVIKRPTESYYSLGYFESANGVDWLMKKEVLNTGADLSNPSIIKIQGGYLLFVTRYDNNTIYKIYSSVCDNNFNCSSDLSIVINPNTSINSEKNGVFAGHPFQQNGRTYLFFGAWGGDGFKLKLAYSDDLINWQRCSNSFLYGGDGPFPYQENNDLYLFFHRSDSSGIKYAKTTLPLSCSSVFTDLGYQITKNQPYDQNHIIFPSLINENGALKIFYTGLGMDGVWRLNMAFVGSEDPTPTPRPPIILIPGFLASWNKESIIHNSAEPQSNWKINPMVNDYKAIIQTLKNLGYEENKNLFIFAYDWRKPILDIVDDLNNYIERLQTINYPLQTSFQIIGHSLGGLVGRIYLQKYNNLNINKLITVGSPHLGATQFYKLVEAGEIDRSNNYQWLAAKTLIVLNKNNIETDKQTINRIFP
ncbi:MAG: alpha/beta hydrolase, partial [bacterium]|nr:alpha/beta hydrolase [bacterium]